MAMAAMGASNEIILTQNSTYTCGDGLFARAEVHLAADLPLLPQLFDRELVVASAQHLAIELVKDHGDEPCGSATSVVDKRGWRNTNRGASRDRLHRL